MRETGPTFKVFANELLGLEGQNDTKPYIGVARTFLGMLKAQMQLGGITQGRMVRELEDGTRIVVQSINGIDKFAIIAPSSPPPVTPTPEPYEPKLPTFEPVFENPPETYESLWAAACGYCFIQDEGQQAAVWRTLQSVPLMITRGAASSSEAHAISDNGMAVVGQMTPLTGGSSRAFIWTSTQGVQQIPTPGFPAAALCVDSAGVTVGGYCNSNGEKPFIYTAARGVELIPGIAIGGRTTCISPGGGYAAGWENIPVSNGNNRITWVARREGNAWVKRQVPNSGATSRESSFQGPIEDPIDEHYEPVNVDDMGRVTLVDNHKTGAYVSGSIRYFSFHEAVPPFNPGDGITMLAEGEWFMNSPNSMYQVDAPSGAGFHRYTWGTAAIDALADGTAAATADDLQVTVGSDAFGSRTLHHFPVTPGAHLIVHDTGVHLGDSPATEVRFHNYIAESVTRAWWWSRTSGKVYLAPDNSTALDISEDGVVIVGYSYPDGNVSNARPMYWMRMRGPGVQMQYVGVNGRVKSVARPRNPKVTI